MSVTFPKVTEGEAPFLHPSLPKPCKTWYKVVGDLSKSSSGRPLIVLHGGPGACHNYLLSLTDLATHHGIPIVLYDQLGNGKSTHIREKRLDTSFWTPQLFMDELESLLKHLSIADYDLLGQSWGGMMGSMWAIRGHSGLKKLIISNSPASMELWIESCNGLRKLLPEDVQEKLDKHEKDGTYDDEEYEQAVMVFYKRHLCRIDPFPEDVATSLEWLSKDDTVYMTMNGPSEFTIIGSLKTWSVVDEVHKITVPTLVLHGQFDEAQAVCVAPFQAIPNVELITLNGSSHMSNVEVRDEYMEIVSHFLKTV